MPVTTEFKASDNSLEMEDFPPYKALTREEARVAADFLQKNSPSAYEKLISYFKEIYPDATDVCVSPRRVVLADMSTRPFGTPVVEFFGSKENDGQKTEIQDSVSLNVFTNRGNPLTSEEMEKIAEAAEMVSIDYKGGA